MDKFLKYLYTQRSPKTYGEVSALFESNYQKILNLIPTLKDITHNSVIRHDNEQDLYLLVEDKTPYTAIFILQQINPVDFPKIKHRPTHYSSVRQGGVRQ
jgi:uncharacterized protein YqiB (DUF1249 family)